MIPGIDVSNNNGAIDWSLTGRIGLQFGIAKLTESTNFVDSYFAANWQGMKDGGMVRGAYCFGRPSKSSGHADANFFLSHLPTLEKGDFLVLDLEDENVPDKADLLAYTLDWLRTVSATVHFKPMLYSGHYYLEPHNCEKHPDTLGQYGLWVADYQTKHKPTVPDGWAFFSIWQYSGSGVVPGIVGDVDMNVANVSSKGQLAKYGRP